MNILIIRFSSFGDIFSCLGGVAKKIHPGQSLTLVTKEEYVEPVKEAFPNLNVIGYNKKTKLLGLLKLSYLLAKEDFDLVYDAHNNQRSLLLRVFFLFSLICRGRLKLCFLDSFSKALKVHFVIRSKDRLKRFAFFYLNYKKAFPTLFYAEESYWKPLSKPIKKITQKNLETYRSETEIKKVKENTNIETNPDVQWETKEQTNKEFQNKELQDNNNFKAKKCILFCPGGAWKLKHWPKDYWNELCQMDWRDYEILIIGGEKDSLYKAKDQNQPHGVLDRCGDMSLGDTVRAIKKASLIISNDTGTLHVSHALKKPSIGLFGPSAFGFLNPEANHQKSLNLFTEMDCRPCSKDGRGKCKNSIYMNCLKTVKPTDVYQAAWSRFL